MSEPFGFLVIDKPKGLTSHDVVDRVRRGIRVKRVGHAGTLDPMATGVLVLCIGAATRLSEYIMHTNKVYEAAILLGVETNTYDADGEVVATSDIDNLTNADVESALTYFQGEVQQIPPMYSAIKRSGKKLYELAREGEEVEREPRTVQLDTYLLHLELPVVQIMVGCSPGTYIRSIAHDLGAMLGVGGHLTALNRLRCGGLRNPIAYDTIITSINDGTWRRYLIDEHVALPEMAALYLDDQDVDDILHGRTIACQPPFESADNEPPPLARAYAAGRFVAILESQGGRWHPTKVFHPVTDE